MNPSRSGAPSGARNPFAPAGSATQSGADSHLQAQVRGLGAAAHRSTQIPTVGGTADPWFYDSHSQGQLAHGAEPQTSTYYGPSSQQEEAYVRQYQQWAEAYPSGTQQNLMSFATQAEGRQSAYDDSTYTDLRGGSYTTHPVQPAGATQNLTNQQFTHDNTYQRQNPADPAYASLYGLVSTSSAAQGTSSRQANQGLQAGGQQGYPTQNQAQASTVAPCQTRSHATYPPSSGYTQQVQQSQQSSQTHSGYVQRQPPSRDRTLSSSPVSWPSDGMPITEPTTRQTGHVHKPVQQLSAGQRTNQSLAVPGPSGVKDASSAPPSLGGGSKNKRKRMKRADDTDPEDGESAEESEDEDARYAGGISVGVAGFGVASKARKGRNGKPSRLTGACKHCKKLKMKCEFTMGDQRTCNRCRTSGYVCIVEGRKPRNAPNKREYLLAQIRQKDSVIESLLKQLHNPYVATPLSIASYRLATSPSDKNNQDVLEWLEQLVASVRENESKVTTQAFLNHREKKDTESDNDDQTVEENNDADDDPESPDPATQIGSSLPEPHVPIGLIANLSLSNKKPSRKSKKNSKDDVKDIITLAEDDFNDDNVGVANETYFMPGPATDLGIRATLINQHSPPEILVHGLVTPSDVDALFDIFYERINPFVSLLDRKIHTPGTTFARCPFLFTVVCAVASRYYAEKSQVYPVAMHFAKSSAATALIDGWKSVELCQAYILMATYAVPARRWEEDRSWLYTGLAIRIATDLNLHHVSTVKPTNEMHEREILNKRRVWLICCNLDRSTATQFGKPSTIKEDYIVRNAKDWYKSSQYNHEFDVHLVGYSALLQIVARFHDEIFSDPSSPTGLNKNVDFRSVTLEHDAHLVAFEEEWTQRFDEDSKQDDPACLFRRSLMPFLVAYSRLVMYSFGFQQALIRGLQQDDGIYFTKCLESAKAVIVSMLDSLAPSGYMRYAPDGHFVFASFASAFLLKLLRPELSKYLTKEGEDEIFDLISQLINTLSSNHIAIDDRHTPRLYARFLAGLLFRHRRDGVTVGRLQTQPQPPPKQGSGGPTPGASMTTFSVSPPTTGTSGYNMQGGSPSYGAQDQGNPVDSIIFTPEATFGGTGGPINFAPGDMMGSYSVNAFSEEETLATMQVINNPAWWKDVLMPGFSGSWPENSPSPPASGPSSSGSPYLPSNASGRFNAMGSSPQMFGGDITGPAASFNIFHSMQMGNTEIPLY